MKIHEFRIWISYASPHGEHQKVVIWPYLYKTSTDQVICPKQRSHLGPS